MIGSIIQIDFCNDYNFPFTQVIDFSQVALEVTDLQAKEKLNIIKANLSIKHAENMKKEILNLKTLKMQSKNLLEIQQVAYEGETELLLEKYDSITKEEKDSFIQRINEKYESYKVHTVFQTYSDPSFRTAFF